MEAAVFAIYVGGKYLAYAVWSYLGLRWLANRNSPAAGVRFGFVRLGLGILFGVSIFLAGGMMHLAVPAHPWLLYVAIYAPVRYVEWSIMAALLVAGQPSARKLSEGVAQWWILGGILVSHLADLPIILLNYEGTKAFLPVGRFLC